MYEFNYPGLYDGSPVSASSAEEEIELLKKLLEELEAAIKDLWRWQWEEKVDEHWEEVERRYAEILKGGRAEKVKEKGERKWCTIM